MHGSADIRTRIQQIRGREQHIATHWAPLRTTQLDLLDLIPTT
jgi:hypothetical protein